MSSTKLVSRALYFSLKRQVRVSHRVRGVIKGATISAVVALRNLQTQELDRKVKEEFKRIIWISNDIETDAELSVIGISGELQELEEHTNRIRKLLRIRAGREQELDANYYPFIANSLERRIAGDFGYQTYDDVIKHSEILTKDPSKREILEKHKKILGEVTIELRT